MSLFGGVCDEGLWANEEFPKDPILRQEILGGPRGKDLRHLGALCAADAYGEASSPEA